ncbi:MAG: hypothetical protein ACK5NT_06155 [Pyrinomonadaceae bacterium]
MFCPRCGEELQVQQLRFCPKCGIPLALVYSLVANEGTIPELQIPETGSFHFSRKKGILLAIFWFIFFTPFMAAITGGIFDWEVLASISAVFGVFGSIFILLFSVFLLKGERQIKEEQSRLVALKSSTVSGNRLGATPVQKTAQQEFRKPEAGMWREYETGEMAATGTVYERETRLLNQEEEEL